MIVCYVNDGWYYWCGDGHRTGPFKTREEAYNLAHPELPGTRWDIYMEGFVCTGQRAGASLLSTVYGPKTWHEACDKAFASPDHAQYYDPESLTYWGCKLFDNLHDAQRSFG